MRWSQHGFGRSSATTPGQTTPRNLMGFKDGTANIRSDETEALDKHVWVAADDSEISRAHCISRALQVFLRTQFFQLHTL
jgi:deferrochelatase/peroxidase EfeB